MKKFIACLLLLAAAGCTVVPQQPTGGGPVPPRPSGPSEVIRSQSTAVASYRRSVNRIEPVAEALCRRENPGFPPRACDFRFAVISDPRAGINAFQSIGRDGRPQVTFTVALLRRLRTDDEVAFIVGHETAHQILRHIPKTQAQQRLGAVLIGGLVAATGNASQSAVNQAANIGAAIGGRAYSKQFELEADVMATWITSVAGYDPVSGAAPFSRMETGSNRLLSTHPPSAQRFQIVRQTANRLEADRRRGINPPRLPRL